MPEKGNEMEAVTIRAVAGEVEALCVPSRVSSVGQSSALEVFLALQRGGERYLVLSARPEAPSFHLAAGKPRTLPSPTAFCRLLRKRLGGLVLTAVGRRGLERAVDLFFGPSAAELPRCRLAVEIMGRWSNIVLTEEPAGMIVDSIHHVPQGVSRLRAVLPGEEYLPPPRHGRADPTELSREECVALCRSAAEDGRALSELFVGLGRGTMGLVAGAEGDRLCGDFCDGIRDIVSRADRGETSPVLYPGRRLALPFPVASGWSDEARTFPSVSAALERLYDTTAGDDERRSLASDLRRRLTRQRKRLRKTLRRLEEETDSSREEAGLQEAAGAILSSLSSIERGAKRFAWTDASGTERSVDLDPALSPRRNAEVLFKKVRKLRRRAELARQRLPAVTAELEKTDALIRGIPELPLEDLRAMTPAKVSRGKAAGTRTGRRPPVREYRRDGWRILVGKSSRGNDELTVKIARAEEVWMHTRDFAGAHVVVRGDGDPPEEVVRAAAEAAAWHSAGRNESWVDVSVTRRKHVRKVKGQAPGQVLVSRAKTVRVRPRVPAGFAEVRPAVIK